jgi:hypothetical protein
MLDKLGIAEGRHAFQCSTSVTILQWLGPLPGFGKSR